jgi:hypothetical protein
MLYCSCISAKPSPNISQNIVINNPDGFAKSPTSALRCIPALLNSRYARRRSALPSKSDFLRDRQPWTRHFFPLSHFFDIPLREKLTPRKSLPCLSGRRNDTGHSSQDITRPNYSITAPCKPALTKRNSEPSQRQVCRTTRRIFRFVKKRPRQPEKALGRQPAKT